MGTLSDKGAGAGDGRRGQEDIKASLWQVVSGGGSQRWRWREYLFSFLSCSVIKKKK